MKRLVIPSLLLAALASWAANPHLAVVARKNVAAGGAPWTQTFSETGGSTRSIGQTGAGGVAFEFVPTNTISISQVTFYALSFGTAGTNRFEVEIWTDNGSSNPGVALPGTTVVVNQSDLAATNTAHTVTLGAAASLTNAATYYVVFWPHQLSAFNYAKVDYNATGGSGWDIHGSTDGTNYTGNIDFDAYMRGGISE